MELLKIYNTFLYVVSELHENECGGTLILSKVCQAEESGLGEALDGNVPKPHVEALALLVKDTWEAPASLLAIEAVS